jgi:hypothetical protein
VVLSILALLIVFCTVRFIVVRFSGSTLLANLLGVTVVLAFVIGSLVRPFGWETATMATSNVPASAEPSSATPPTAAPILPSTVRNVTGKCGRLSVKPNVGGIGSFDVLAEGADGTNALGQGVSVGRNREYVALGWGVDDDRENPAIAVCLLVDGKVALRATSLYGTVRPDVAQVLNAPGLGNAGFKIIIPPDSLSAGAHTLSVAVLSKDRSLKIAPNSWNVLVR